MLLKSEVSDSLIRFFRASAVDVEKMRIEAGIQIACGFITYYLLIYYPNFPLRQDLQFSGEIMVGMNNLITYY
jgi:hypothetical protein